MKYIYYLSLTFSRFDKKWYIVVAAVFAVSVLIGVILVKRGKLSFLKMVVHVLFVSYLVLVLFGTVISREPQTPLRLNNNFVNYWQAFFSGSFAVQIEALSNIILFIPFGCLLPMIIGNNFTWAKRSVITVLGAVLFTFTIELIQFVTGRGLFETADIGSNLIGAFMGLAFFSMGYGILIIGKHKKQIKKR